MYENEWEKLISIIKNYDVSNINRLLYAFELDKLLIAAEDHRFMSHHGVDYIALCRATWRTLFCGRREGGSTIAMQLVRVLTNKYDITLSRKFSESYLAIRLTKNIPKDKIISLYLSVAYFGWNMNGIIEAIQKLNLDQNNLSQYDAASLIARLKYPEPKVKSLHRKNLIEIRAKYILSRYEKLFLRRVDGTI